MITVEVEMWGEPAHLGSSVLGSQLTKMWFISDTRENFQDPRLEANDRDSRKATLHANSLTPLHAWDWGQLRL